MFRGVIEGSIGSHPKPRVVAGRVELWGVGGV